jgi:uncharacterized protein with HEPN domain
MTSSKSSLQYLLDMLQYADKSIKFIHGYTAENYFTDDYRTLALRHAIMIMGEAASKVDAETKATLHQIPWMQIIAVRNRIVHAYEGVNELMLWNIAIDHLPALKQHLQDYLKQRGIEL